MKVKSNSILYLCKLEQAIDFSKAQFPFPHTGDNSSSSLLASSELSEKTHGLHGKKHSADVSCHEDNSGQGALRKASPVTCAEGLHSTAQLLRVRALGPDLLVMTQLCQGGPWARCLTTLCLSFPACKVGFEMADTSQSGED